MDKHTRPEIQPHVLIIEHDPELRKIMKLSLEQSGLNVFATGRFANALEVLQQDSPDLFLIDSDFEDNQLGILVSAFRDRHRGPVLVSAAERLEDGWRRKYEPDSVIYKPFDIRHLIRMTWMLLKRESDFA